jgi:hypothetical protein
VDEGSPTPEPTSSGKNTFADGPADDQIRCLPAVTLGKLGQSTKEALPALQEAKKYQEIVRKAAEEAILLIEGTG